MVDCIYKVSDYMSKLPAFVQAESHLDNVLSKMLKFKMKELPVIDSKIKVKNFVSQKTLFKYFDNLDSLSISDILSGENHGIIAYPDSDLDEIYSIMKSLSLHYIPIVKNPWDRKLMGFLCIKKLEKQFKKKVSIAS